MTKEENVREDKNKKECMEWLEKCTWGEAAIEWRRQEVAKGGVFVAYGTLCRYDAEGGDGPGVYSLGGQLVEW